MAEILRRGHKIGLHPSYAAAEKFALLAAEKRRLEAAVNKMSENGEILGARMHYLRWFGPHVWRAMANNGLQHDASLGFADHIGFRCGTCHPFQGYDVVHNQTIDIVVHPLTVMDVSVIDPAYMALGSGEAAFTRIDAIRKACKKVNGDFTLLWHNSRLVHEAERKLFQQIVQTM